MQKKFHWLFPLDWSEEAKLYKEVWMQIDQSSFELSKSLETTRIQSAFRHWVFYLQSTCNTSSERDNIDTNKRASKKVERKAETGRRGKLFRFRLSSLSTLKYCSLLQTCDLLSSSAPFNFPIYWSIDIVHTFCSRLCIHSGDMSVVLRGNFHACRNLKATGVDLARNLLPLFLTNALFHSALRLFCLLLLCSCWFKAQFPGRNSIS